MNLQPLAPQANAHRQRPRGMRHPLGRATGLLPAGGMIVLPAPESGPTGPPAVHSDGREIIGDGEEAALNPSVMILY